MPDRQYIACAFKPGQRPYTFHWEGDPLSVGDRVVVFSRGREQRVSVIAVLDKAPEFETKAILRVVDEGAVEKPAPAELPDDSLPI